VVGLALSELAGIAETVRYKISRDEAAQSRSRSLARALQILLFEHPADGPESD
jgi:hypothetical protein